VYFDHAAPLYIVAATVDEMGHFHSCECYCVVGLLPLYNCFVRIYFYTNVTVNFVNTHFYNIAV